jgi:alkanesulfonate monooxygenase SsuD/methylene tetrahydromethanopterin reductase-like flavin-dependent oxidoreductase (luciferase family)
VAETDEAALTIARRAYPLWHDSFTYLFRRHGRSMRLPRPEAYDTLMQIGQGVAGSPATVTAWLRDQVEQTGANYIVGQFAFGDLSFEECRRSITLFAERVMPALRS